jgi:hypothetical protein
MVWLSFATAWARMHVRAVEAGAVNERVRRPSWGRATTVGLDGNE